MRGICFLIWCVLAVTSSRAHAWQPPFSPPELQVPDGFTVELAAGPPLVGHPMMAGFDDRGRLFVAESAGKNLRAPDLLKEFPNSIRMLEDTNSDGLFDKSTVYADQITLPMGALWHRGALYVAAPPSIWRFEDTTGDGVADRRDEIVTKFGFNGNAASIHGCFLGPAGRIYWTDGRHGHEFAEHDGQPGSKGLAARVFSCRPDGSDVEVFAGGGMDNPVEVAFGTTGEMFGTMTFYNPDQARHDALVHFIYGGVYPKHHDCLREFKRTGDLLPPLSLFGVAAPSGCLYTQSSGLGAEYQHDLFTTHFNTHKIVRHDLSRSGATFETRDEDFLVCDSPDFHPTDVLEDADGSLLVIDTGGWFRIGCPTSQVAKPDILGAIYRVKRTDAPPARDPRGLALMWPQLKPAELVKLLDDERFAVRERALEALAVGGQDSIAALRQGLRPESSELVARNAVWSLARIDLPAARAALREALSDVRFDVRLAAVHSLASLRDPASREKLVQLAATDQPAIRREAATALGRIGDQAAVPGLLAALRSPGDRFQEHALIFALIQLNDPLQTQAGLADPAPSVRRAALIALDQMDSGQLTREQVAGLLDTSDVELQRTALAVIGKHEGWSDEIVGLLGGWLRDPQPIDARAEMIRGALLAFKSDTKIQALLGEALHRNTTPASTRMLLLEVISRSELNELPSSWLPGLEAALASSDNAIVRQAIETASATGSNQFAPQLAALGRDATRDPALRVAAFAAALGRGGPLDANAFDFLTARLADPEASALAKLGAADALSRASLTQPQLLELTRLVQQAGPLELPTLFAAFERAHDEQVGLALVAALGRSPGLPSLPASRLGLILAKYPESVQAAAADLLARLEVDLTEQRARLAQFESQLGEGHPGRGRDVFFGKKAGCFACHKVGNEGNSIGPNLSKIGEVRTPRDLLEAILYPSLSFARGYESYQVTLDDGRVVSGLIGRETAEAVYLRNERREEIRVLRSSIEEMLPGKLSIMPQGLERTLSQQELADLVTFLRQQK